VATTAPRNFLPEPVATSPKAQPEPIPDMLVALALLVLPGPGLVLLTAGLALLATEFAWTQRWLTRLLPQASSAWRRRFVIPADDTAPPAS
jgi:Putative transmembrane protein (PGPGW)